MGWFLPFFSVTVIVWLGILASVFYFFLIRGRHNIPAKGKPVLVTGAGSGFGLELTKILLARGCFVYAVDVNETALKEHFGKESQDRIRALKCDISDTADVERMSQWVEGCGKGLYAIVNNAGVAPAPHSLVETPEKDMTRTININLLGMWKVTKALWPQLRQWRENQGKGGPGAVILNVTSCAGLISAPFMGPYTMSKFGAESFTDCLRRELRPYGVRVVAVEPYFADTNILNVIRDTSVSSEGSSFTGTLKRNVGFINKLKLLSATDVARIMAGELFSTSPYTRQIIAYPWDYLFFKLGWISTHFTDSLADFVMVDIANSRIFGRRRRPSPKNTKKTE